MNIAVGTTGCKYLAPTDRTDIFVGRVGSDLAAQAQDRVHHIAANARSQNVFGNCCEDCTHSFKTDRSSSLDFENCWRWLVLAPSGPGQLEEMNSYCCVFTAKTLAPMSHDGLKRYVCDSIQAASSRTDGQPLRVGDQPQGC
jgi:hypothetical protein